MIKPNGWEELKNKYPELYEAIVAHSIWYDCEVGEGHVMDDRALPLGWLGVYLDIVRKKGYEEGQEDMSEKIDDIKSDERKRCLDAVKEWMRNNPLDDILRKYKVSDEDILALRDTLTESVQAISAISNYK